MAQKIELNGHTFRVWFKHAQRNMDVENDKFIDAAVANALSVGQIKKYVVGNNEFDPCVKAATLCQIETDDDKHEIIAFGYSFCSESEGQFIKSDARNRALGRAVKAYWKSVGGKVRTKR